MDTAWFADEQLSKEYLLFHVSDAQEVWQGLDELSRETDAAKAKALERLGREAEKIRDERPFEERAEEARKASEALESERGHARVHERPASLGIRVGQRVIEAAARCSRLPVSTSAISCVVRTR